MLKRLKKKKGFTLVELLAVIVVLAIIALIGYSVVGDVISGAQESADKENVREYARSVRLAITSAQMNGQIVSSELDRNWLNDNVKKTGNEVICNSVIDNNGTITLSGCSVGGSVQEYCYDGTNITTCTKGTISRIYGTDDATFYNDKKTTNLFDQTITKMSFSEGFSNTTLRTFDVGKWYKGLTLSNYSRVGSPNFLYAKVGGYVTQVRTGSQQAYGLAQAFLADSSKYYTIHYDEFESDSGNLIGFSFYDNDGKHLLFKYLTNLIKYDEGCVKPPDDAKWMIVSLPGAFGVGRTYSNIQLVEVKKGETKPSYEPYGYKIPINATKEGETPVTITVYIGSDPLGANDYIEYKDSKWYVVRDGSSMEAPMVKGEVPTGKVTYSVTGLDDSNFVYNYE